MRSKLSCYQHKIDYYIYKIFRGSHGVTTKKKPVVDKHKPIEYIHNIKRRVSKHTTMADKAGAVLMVIEPRSGLGSVWELFYFLKGKDKAVLYSQMVELIRNNFIYLLFWTFKNWGVGNSRKENHTVWSERQRNIQLNGCRTIMNLADTSREAMCRAL